MLFPLMLIFCCVALALFATAVHEAIHARNRGKPAWHLAWLAVTLGWLCLAVLVYWYGTMETFYFMIDEQCPARGGGAFVDYHETPFPLSGVLECTERTIQLVPSWINPVGAVLLTTAALSAAVSMSNWPKGNGAQIAH